MTLRIGSIIGYQNEPSIYIIIKRNYIYIGETQRLPVLRWGEHLCNVGTFTTKLQKLNIDLAQSNNFKLYFFSYSCRDILNLFDSTDLVKRNTQYIEDVLHRKFISHEICTKFILLSDTEKTAPLRSNNNQVETISENIFNLILEDLNYYIIKNPAT